MENLKRRVESYIKNKGLTNKSFEDKAGLSNGAVSKMGNNTRRSTIDKISTAFPDLNTAWILTGEGNMLHEEKGILATKENTHTIRYYPNVDASLGDVEFLENPEENSFPINVPGFVNCQCAINAFGDSMLPLIKSGQIIFLSIWTERYIEWGEIYLVITQTGRRTIKRLMPYKDNDNCIECHSENAEQYPPFCIEKSDIVKLYRVLGCISRFEI